MITSRDRELLKKLSQYGFLSTELIRAIVFSSVAKTTVLRRLRLLEECFYVKRILGLDSQEVLWTLTEKAAALVDSPIPKRNWSKNLLDHDYKLLCLRLHLERHGIVHSWTPEHEVRRMVFQKYGHRGSKERVIPDAFMAIETNGAKESVAIELELTMKNSDRYKQTFRRYADKRGVHAIWYIVQNEGTLQHIYRNWRSITSLYSVPRLYLSLFEDVMKAPLKAKLRGEKCYLLEELWTPVKGAHSPAQGVSTSNEIQEHCLIETSPRDHTPFEKDSA